tara:strand:+ start:1995 stop:5714 length:3720 start_codon:yes stop_codon:yes gene_type:complete
MTEFNLFGNATDGEIRVAYISTERGLVDNVTVCEANDYAKLNPGTQFIFRTREYTKYMNINGVNKLTPDDLMPKKECEGIEMTKECGPPQVFFTGGGGVGIKGNPIIGQDGAVLAIDLVSGGFGFQNEPNVEVKDNCGIGAGGNFKAELGEIAEQWEYYDLEEDFEEYEICEGATDTGVFGNRYGINGENLGVWEPKLYANFKQDPLRKEIKKYQDFLAQGTNPWWTTRKDAPLSMTGERGTTRRVYNVDHSEWSEFMNKHAISPKPKSNVSGSDFAGIPYSFVWEENFPYDGEYVFRGAKDNKAEFYLDGVFVSNLDGFKGALNPIKKTIKAGNHQIRIDLINAPVKVKVKEQQSTEIETQVAGVDFVKKAKGYYMIVGGNEDVEVSLQLYYKDNPNTAGTAITKITIPNTDGDALVLEREKDGSSWKHKGSVSSKSVFKKNELGYGPIQFEGNVKDPILQKKNNAYGPNSPKYGELKFIDNHGDDTNGRLSIVSAKNLQENRVKELTPTKSTETKEIEISNVFNTVDYIDKANRPLWRTNVYNRGGFINEYGICPFDTMVQLEDNPYSGTHTITWNNVNFPIDGNYDIAVQVDDNVTITIEGKGKTEVIKKRGFAGDSDKSTGKSTYIRNFLKGNYTITAELEQIPGGKFGFSGIKGINPMALAINIQTVFTEKEVISAKSWNENPMGIALTIDAPEPPIPQEKIPEAPGRCPRNPMWTTRHPNADKRWYPVRFEGWSPFFNRYALSPVAPRNDVSSDGGGSVFTNFWQQEIPYNGWYKLIAEVDDIARIYVNGDLKLDLSRRTDKIKGEKKFFLSKGTTEIKVEVENYKFETFKMIDKKIFNTSDWAVNQKEKDGIKYEGPELATYLGGELGPALTPKWDFEEDKVIDDEFYREGFMGTSWTSTWENVEFPEDGQYQIKCLVDDTLSVKLDGQEIATAVIGENLIPGQNYRISPVKTVTFNATKGKRTLSATYTNIPGDETSTFYTNPVHFSFVITRKVNVGTGITKSWLDNPIGLSAVLVPPPCPKRISGKGTITNVIVDDPGNGFPRPHGAGYPVGLGLSAINIKDAGINYNCAVDNIRIEPNNGSKLSLVCDNFGRISNVVVDEPGLGFTEWPQIIIDSDTGVNFEATPVFGIIRDPIVADPDKLIQVTDLAGIKQTGYYQGRPYYGAVFYKDNVRYAGWYETPGQLVQIYDTMQESIDAEVTTPPSAILKQGSDVSSNDPKLNLPGTPENLT